MTTGMARIMETYITRIQASLYMINSMHATKTCWKIPSKFLSLKATAITIICLRL